MQTRLHAKNGVVGEGVKFERIRRVTGYLVKKSELAKLDAGKQSLNNVSIFGKGARDCSDALDRRIVGDHEGSR